MKLALGCFVGALMCLVVVGCASTPTPKSERAARGENAAENGLRVELSSVWVVAQTGEPRLLNEMMPADESVDGAKATRVNEKPGWDRTYIFIPWDGGEVREIHGLASSIAWSSYGVVVPKWFCENSVNSPFNDFAVTWFYPVTGVAVSRKDLLAHYAGEYQRLMASARLEVLPEQPPANYQPQVTGDPRIPNPPQGLAQHPNKGLMLPTGSHAIASQSGGSHARQNVFDGSPNDPRWTWQVRGRTGFPRDPSELANTVPPQ